MMVAEAGFGVGKKASKNIVAGKSQRSIAALSIGCSSVRGRNAMQAASNCGRALSGTIRGVDIVRGSLVRLPDHPIFPRTGNASGPREVSEISELTLPYHPWMRGQIAETIEPLLTT